MNVDGFPFRHLLVPTDGSETSLGALQVAVEMAAAVGAEITTLYVVDATTFAARPGEIEYDAIRESLAEESRMALAKARELCEARAVRCHSTMREGHPVEEILSAAKDVDLVVMGTHGRSALQQLLIGSVTEKVLRHCDTPILTVRVPT